MKDRFNVLLGMAMHRDALSLLKEEAEVEPMPSDRETLIKKIGTYDGIISYQLPYSGDDLKDARKLKVISCHTISDDALAAASKRGIVVTLVPSLWDTVADLTLALMFAAARNIPQAHQSIKAGLWKNAENLKIQYSGHDIFGKTLGILGLGQIGKILAARVQGFDMKILYNDISKNPEFEKKYGLEYRTLKQLLAESDIFVVLVPLDNNTQCMLGEEEFKLMKKDAIIVNPARGAILDEKALYKALKEKWISAAGLDVLTNEPINADNPLLSLDNVIFTPHLGGSTKECDMVLVDDTLRVLRGDCPIFGINISDIKK